MPGTLTNPAPPALIGQAALVRMAFEGRDLSGLTDELIRRLGETPDDPGLLMDLSTIFLSQGEAFRELALDLQHKAVSASPDFVIRHGTGLGPRLLAFVTPGDFMANTPVDFLLEGSDSDLILHHLDGPPPRFEDLPDHDIALLAVGESPGATRLLDAAGPALLQWPVPVLNNAPHRIARLTRDVVAEVLGGAEGVLAPPVCRATRAGLLALAEGSISPAQLSISLDFPMLLRPIGSHGGQGLVKLQSQMDLLRWLAQDGADEVFLMPFVDYRGEDELYTKYRVAMIGGHPYASHMAASDHWMVHYLNAEMESRPERRASEAGWMAGFETGLALRHARALSEIQDRIGLDYYAIDCAEAPDGRLLVFEVDTAMIIHDMDDARVFPYKKPAMRKLFDGFLTLMTTRLPPSAAPERRRVA